MEKDNIPNIPAEKFRFVSDGSRLHDQKLGTKKIGYFRDAFNRFCKNRSSVIAAVIILLLVMYAIFVPVFCTTNYAGALTDTMYLQYTNLLPKNELCVALGLDFWDGCSDVTVNGDTYNAYKAIMQESGKPVIKKEMGTVMGGDGKERHELRVDSYLANGYAYLTLTAKEYADLQQWQIDNNIQVIYPAVTNAAATDANIWYEANRKGAAKLDKDGNFVNDYKTYGRDDYNSLRVEGDPGIEDPEAADRYRYANVSGTSENINYKVRVFKDSYFQYRYGHEASFLFGTTKFGQDILTRLANAARFSLMFAVCVAAINLFIGVVIGALEGYYGGAFDLIIERIIDILARVPFMVVATLFQLHLAAKVGPVVSMLFAFILTGWIGTAGTTRMQFYRFKGQEYVLAARVLGAKDGRIMFRHIFPNALGTLITSSVLVIPGVIFSESSLTYLGIVNLDSSTMTSVGTMLALAKDDLSKFPHAILFPALFISLLEISFNLFGNGLRDAFNPSLRGADE